MRFFLAKENGEKVDWQAPYKGKSQAMPDAVTVESPEILINQRPRLASGIVRAAIAGDLTSGLSVDQIAAKYGIGRTCAYYHIRKINEQQIIERNSDPRVLLRVKMERPAVSAVLAGLRAKADPYKRANIGIQALKGLGLFDGDSQTVNFQVQAVTDPIEARYLAIHGRYPSGEERAALEATPVDGERVEDREPV